jgi:hypothetical protein
LQPVKARFEADTMTVAAGAPLPEEGPLLDVARRMDVVLRGLDAVGTTGGSPGL